MILLRLLPPAARTRSRRGNPHSLASKAISAALARFSAGGAVTDIFKTGVPSAERTIPSMRLAPARGVRRIWRRTPSAVAASGASLHDGGGKVVEDQPAQEH